MEQILRQLVEDGEKVAMVKFTSEGDIELMGNKDIVKVLETQKETIEIKANIAGAKGMGNEFVKVPPVEDEEGEGEEGEEGDLVQAAESTEGTHQDIFSRCRHNRLPEVERALKLGNMDPER
jgi:hypothetical protein